MLHVALLYTVVITAAQQVKSAELLDVAAQVGFKAVGALWAGAGTLRSALALANITAGLDAKA